MISSHQSRPVTRCVSPLIPAPPLLHISSGPSNPSSQKVLPTRLLVKTRVFENAHTHTHPHTHTCKHKSCYMPRPLPVACLAHLLFPSNRWCLNTHTHTHTHSYTHTHTHKRTCARARTHAHTHTNALAHAHAHTRVHTHIHTRPLSLSAVLSDLATRNLQWLLHSGLCRSVQC